MKSERETIDMLNQLQRVFEQQVLEGRPDLAVFTLGEIMGMAYPISKRVAVVLVDEPQEQQMPEPPKPVKKSKPLAVPEEEEEEDLDDDENKEEDTDDDDEDDLDLEDDNEEEEAKNLKMKVTKKAPEKKGLFGRRK